MRVHYDGPSHEGDLQAQLMSFDRFRKEGYAGIILAPAQNRAFRTPVDRAIAAGMPIVILGSDLGIQSPSLAYVLTDDTVGGRLAANRMAQILPKGGRLAVMGLTPDHSSTQERDRSFENELSQTHPSLHVVERSRGSANVAQEEQIAEDLLAGSGQVDGILALTSTATRGAYYAVMSQPRVRHIAIIGFDQDLLPPIRAGQIDAVIAQPAHTMGELAARTICQLRNGTTTNARVVVAPLLVTRQSIDDPGVTTQLDGAWWDAEKK
jgi:ribose transport system substrate-binding protein